MVVSQKKSKYMVNTSNKSKLNEIHMTNERDQRD